MRHLASKGLMMVIVIIMVDHLATDIMPSLEKGYWKALKATVILGADLGAGMGLRGFGRAA